MLQSKGKNLRAVDGWGNEVDQQASKAAYADSAERATAQGPAKGGNIPCEFASNRMGDCNIPLQPPRLVLALPQDWCHTIKAWQAWPGLCHGVAPCTSPPQLPP